MINSKLCIFNVLRNYLNPFFWGYFLDLWEAVQNEDSLDQAPARSHGRETLSMHILWQNLHFWDECQGKFISLRMWRWWGIIQDYKKYKLMNCVLYRSILSDTRESVLINVTCVTPASSSDMSWRGTKPNVIHQSKHEDGFLSQIFVWLPNSFFNELLIIYQYKYV
jgi:hypothetical protein